MKVYLTTTIVPLPHGLITQKRCLPESCLSGTLPRPRPPRAQLPAVHRCHCRRGRRPAKEAFLRLWRDCAKVPFERAKGFLFTVAGNLFWMKKSTNWSSSASSGRRRRRWKPPPHFQLETQELHRHRLNFVNMISLKKWGLAANLHLSSGTPYSVPIAVQVPCNDCTADSLIWALDFKKPESCPVSSGST